MKPTRASLILLSAILVCSCTSTTPEPTMKPSTSWPSEAFRNTPPTPSPPPAVPPPTLETFKLSSGHTVHLFSNATLPTVSIQLSLPYGRTHDPKEQPGLHKFAAAWLNQGPANLSTPEFAGKKADLSAQFGLAVGLHQSTFSLYALKRQLQPSLALAFETFQKPALRPEDFTRLQRQTHASLTQTLSTPKKLAQRFTRPLTFGPNHPYSELATPSSVLARTPEETRKALSLFRLQHATLFIAGAITPDEVKTLLEPYLSATPFTPYTSPHTLPAPQPNTQHLFAIHVPNAPQSQLRVMRPGPLRTDPNYIANTLTARILGGSFTSRINMNLREDKGFAYGARVSTLYTRDAGYIVASSSVKTSTTAAALREIAKEFEAICTTQPPTHDELQREQNGWILSLPSRFSTSQSTLGAYSNLAYYGLPFDTYTTLPKLIQATSTQDLQDAARTTLCSPRLQDYVVLVVGDLSAIQDDLESLLRDETFGPRTLQRLNNLGQPTP